MINQNQKAKCPSVNDKVFHNNRHDLVCRRIIPKKHVFANMSLYVCCEIKLHGNNIIHDVQNFFGLVQGCPFKA